MQAVGRGHGRQSPIEPLRLAGLHHPMGEDQRRLGFSGTGQVLQDHQRGRGEALLGGPGLERGRVGRRGAGAAEGVGKAEARGDRPLGKTAFANGARGLLPCDRPVVLRRQIRGPIGEPGLVGAEPVGEDGQAGDDPGAPPRGLRGDRNGRRRKQATDQAKKSRRVRERGIADEIGQLETDAVDGAAVVREGGQGPGSHPAKRRELSFCTPVGQARPDRRAEHAVSRPAGGFGMAPLGEVAGAALPEVRDFDLEIVPELAEVVHSGDEAQHPARLDEAKAGDIGHCRKQPRPDIEQGVHRGGHVEGMVGQRMPGRSARIARLRLSPIAALKSSGRRRSLRRLVMVRRVQQHEDTSRLNRLEIATVRPNFRSGGVARGFPQHQTEVEDQARARMA